MPRCDHRMGEAGAQQTKLWTPFPSSWPGLTRPSTSLLAAQRKQDVDARLKAGHDDADRAGPSRRIARLKRAMTEQGGLSVNYPKSCAACATGSDASACATPSPRSGGYVRA